MNAGVGGFSRGVEAGDGSVPPEIGFDSAHHVVGSGADWRHVGGQIETVAEAGGVDARETFLQEFSGLGGHVQINVLCGGAMHFADDSASDDIACGQLLGFGVALHEALEKNIAEDAAFSAQRLGKQEARRALDGESSGMELHELHVGQDRAGFVGDGQTVAGGDFRIGGFAIDLAEASGGEKNGGGANFVKRAIDFVKEADPNGAAVFKNQASGERVCAKMEMRNLVRASEKSAADFAAGRVPVGMQDAGAAVRGFPGESEFGAGSIEFGAPFDELCNVFRAFFDQECYRFGAAEAVARAESVLLVQTDFVFVAERYGDATLRPSCGGIAEIGFGEDQDATGAAEFNGGAQTGDA